MAAEALEAPPEALDLPGLLPAQRLFLEHFQEHGLVTAAAAATGVPLRLVRRWQKEPAFAAALEDATDVYRDVIRREHHRRAIDGWDEPVYYQGTRVGHVRKYSDALLIQQAKAWLPEYREREQAPVSVNVQNTVVAWREKRLPETQPVVIDGTSREVDGGGSSGPARLESAAPL